MNIKTIDVNVKEWFDRIGGNSYFAGTVTINFGMENEKQIVLPYQYGYGDHYRDMAYEELQKQGIIPLQDSWKMPYWSFYRDNNIIARHYKQEKCLKRELKSIGE